MNIDKDDRLAVLDPDMRARVEAAAKSPPIWTLPPDQGREMRAVRVTSANQPLEEVGSVEVVTIDCDGHPIDVAIYTPAGAEGDVPGVLYIHGGGFVHGSIASVEPTCRLLANRLGAVIISPEYRLAPEHRYPAGLDDSYGAWKWMLANASTLGIDPDRVAVGGVSAGGNFAAAICVRAAALGERLPVAQLLVYPVTHVTFSVDDYNLELALSLMPEAVVWFSEQYLGTTAADRSLADLAEVSPLLAPDLAAMPPAVIVTAQFDILRPQIEAFAERLVASGVDVKLLNYPGVVHGFFGQAPMIHRAIQAVDEASEAFRLLLG